MSKSPLTTEDLKKLESLKLSASARKRIEGELTAHAEFHAADNSSARPVVADTYWWQKLHPALLSLPVIALLMLVVLDKTSPSIAEPQLLPPNPKAIEEAAFDTMSLPRSESSAADDMSTMNMDAVGADETSMLRSEEMPVGVLVEQTEARLESLRNVLDEHRKEFDRRVYSELDEQLKEAEQILIKVLAQSNEATARKVANDAANLAGEVEATLSLQGAITIDPETGHIIDIDFSSS